MNAVQLRIGYADGRVEQRELPTGTYRIGRDFGDIALGDPNVSAVHAELDVQPGRVMVTDLGSSNGTLDLAGNRLAPGSPLTPNQSVKMGASTITLLQPVAGGTQVMAQVPLMTAPGVRAPAPAVHAPPPSPAKGAAPSSLRSRGTILKVPTDGPGLVFVDGAQRQFALEGTWRSPLAPATNAVVDVVFDARGGISAMTAVDPQQLAREQLDQLGDVAQERGRQAAALAQQGVGALAARMGHVALGATVLVWAAWFFFPVLSVNMFVVVRSFTFWDTLAVADMGSFGQSASHGPFAMLGILAILAPLASAFARDPRARLLSAAPLVFIGLAALKAWWGFHEAFNQADKVAGQMSPEMAKYAQEMADNAMKAALGALSVEYGAYVLPIAAVVLATQMFARRPRTGISAGSTAR